jgi:CRISPR/Cas system-associated exonuclease Cas4 (RecB family)
MTYIERIVELDGTITEVELSANQVKEIEKNIKEIEKIQSEVKIKAAEKQALLDRLGITADEAKLLLG